MRVPDIERTNTIITDRSVVYIFEGEEVPDVVGLGSEEKSYAESRLKGGNEFVVINMFNDKYIFLVKQPEEKELFLIREKLRRIAYKIKEEITGKSLKELYVVPINAYQGAEVDFTEALILSIYKFDRYKKKNFKKEKDSFPYKIMLYGSIDEKSLEWLRLIVAALFWVRDAINEPVSFMNSIQFAEEIRKLGAISGFKADILNGKQIEALKMGGILAVNRGSVDPPAFCILEYKPDNCVNNKPIALVGKGIVYDTGGLNIKTGEHMAGMKGDMAGGAAVAGVMSVIAKFGLPVHVVAFIPITDNRPGGNAFTQGDIVTMYNKTTVEVGNTDAEGRLILADAISYASKYDPSLLINIATLTGSASVTFGVHAIAMMTNAKREIVDLMVESGKKVYERVAELPLWEEYGEMIRSDVADLSNVGKGRVAGAITAGKFLENFTDVPLIHLDIAGTGMLNSDDYYRLKEYPGSGMRLLAEFIKKISENYIAN
jgi:leucyl aminopeptidase